jgi:hypothetical protein
MEPEEPLFRLNFGVLLEVPSSLAPCRHERDTRTYTHSSALQLSLDILPCAACVRL